MSKIDGYITPEGDVVKFDDLIKDGYFKVERDGYTFIMKEHDWNIISENTNKIPVVPVKKSEYDGEKVNVGLLDEVGQFERPIIIEMPKALLVELYDFAYKQAVKTGTVDELKEIDLKINSGGRNN